MKQKKVKPNSPQIQYPQNDLPMNKIASSSYCYNPVYIEKRFLCSINTKEKPSIHTAKDYPHIQYQIINHRPVDIFHLKCKNRQALS